MFAGNEENSGRVADGKTVKEIAEETGKSIKTIYAILKKFQKAVVKETGIEPPERKRDLSRLRSKRQLNRLRS